MNQKKKIKSILCYVSVFLIFTLGAFYFMYAKNNEPLPSVCKMTVPEFYCGNLDLSGEAVKGKEKFNSICAACHKLDARSTGPALRGLDSIVYKKWMNDKTFVIDSSKFEKYGIDYHQNLSRVNLDSLDLINLYKYVGFRNRISI